MPSTGLTLGCFTVVKQYIRKDYRHILLTQHIPQIPHYKHSPWKNNIGPLLFEKLSSRAFQWYITSLYLPNIGMLYTIGKLSSSSSGIWKEGICPYRECAFNWEFTLICYLFICLVLPKYSTLTSFEISSAVRVVYHGNYVVLPW